MSVSVWPPKTDERLTADEAHVYNSSHLKWWFSKAFRTWRAESKIQQMVPGVNQRKRHWRWPLMDYFFWPLKCVGVEDLMGLYFPTIWGTSDKVSQEFGQYSISCIVLIVYLLRISLWTTNIESQTLDEAILLMKRSSIFRTLAFVERPTVNPQVSLLNLFDPWDRHSRRCDMVTYRRQAHCVCRSMTDCL